MNRMLIVAAALVLVVLVGCTQGGVRGGVPAGVGAPNDASQSPATNDTSQPPAPNQGSSGTTAQETPSAGATVPATDIGEARAKEIALNHAGLTEAEVVFVRVHLDYDDGRREYEVEFYSGAVEYDYDIDASTGEIRSYDRDAEYYAPAQGGAGSGNAGSGSGAANSGDIGEERAKEIALSHAGYTADGVQWLKVERDYDDGRLEYEVEFHVGRIEYGYEIDAASGTVLHYEAEQDD
jgi:uncharacterized membrane protein YkoI